MPTITVDFVAKTGAFETDAKRAAATTRKAAAEIEAQIKQMGAALATAAAASIGALATLTKKSIDAADNLAKMAQKVGVSVESLSTLGYAADQSGISIESLQGGLVKLAKNAGDAALGTGEAIKGFDALGISVTDADGKLKNNDVLLREIATQFATFEDSAQKTALAVNLFGRSGAELIPLLNEGAEGIGELEERARSLGLEIGTNTAKQAEQFNDLLADAGNLAKGFGNDLASELLPSLNALAEQFVDTGIEGRKAGDAAVFIADGFKGLIAVAYTVKAAIEAVTNTVASYVDIAGAAAKAVTELADNSNPLTMAFKAARGELVPFTETVAEFKNTASAAFVSGATGIQDAVDGLSDSYSAIFAVAPKAGAALEKSGNAAKKAAPALRDLAKEQRQTEKALKDIEKEWNDYAKIIEDVRKDHAELAASYIEQQAHFDQQAQDIQNEINLLGLSGSARDAQIIALEAERLARDKNGDVIEEERQRLEKLLTTLNKEAKAAQELESILSRFGETEFGGLVREFEAVGEAIKKAIESLDIGPPTEEMLAHFAKLQSASEGLRHSMVMYATNAIQDGISSLQSMAAEGSSAFKAMQVAIDALTVVQAISAVLNQGNGDPYTAFARMAAMAAAVSQLVGSIGAFSSGPGAESAAQRQATQGTGTVLGDEFAKSESMLNAMEITANATEQLPGLQRGMLNALNSMQAAIGGASNILARGAGGEVSLSTGASSLNLTGGASLFERSFANIFGGKESLRDQGILIVGGMLSDMIDDIMVQSYATIHRSGGWFSSSRNFDRVADITDDVGVQFQLVLDSMADAVREGAEALGLNMDEVNAAIAAYEIEEIRISTMDLSAEEAQAELEAAFSAIFDGLAGSVVPFIEQFQQVGEGLGETLIRVATGVQVTQEAIIQLGFALDETDPEKFAQASEGLIGLMGGVDAFIDGMQTFVAAFATEEHQFAVAQDALTRAFEQAGLTIPATRDAMWELMQSFDATTEEGREQIATLLRLAGVADSYYSMLEDQAEDAADIAEAAADMVAAAAEEAMAARALLLGVGRDRDYSMMNTAQRAIADVNARFSDLRVTLNATNPTLAEAAELERARMLALEDANAALQEQADLLVGQLLWEESLVGMTELERAQAEINRQFDDYVVQLLDLGLALESTEIATVEQIRANRLLRAEQDALAESAAAAAAAMSMSWTDIFNQIDEFFTNLQERAQQFTREGVVPWTTDRTGFTLDDVSGTPNRADVISEWIANQATFVADLNTQKAMLVAQLAQTPWGDGATIALLQGQIAAITSTLTQVGDDLGESLDYINAVFDQQIESLLGDLAREFGTSDPIEEINARFNDLIEKATAWGATTEQLAEIEEYRLIAIGNLVDERYEAEMDWIRSLADLRDSLLLDPSLSILTPAEMLAEAKSQYEEALAGSLAGDPESRAEFDAASREYLKQARDFWASGQGYTDIFNTVMGNIGSLIDASPATIASNVAETSLEDSLEELRGLREDGEDQTDAVVQVLERVESASVASNATMQAVLAELRRIALQPRTTI